MSSSEIDPNTTLLYRHLPAADNGNFIYTLVHEIRNPLVNIKLAAEVLAQSIKEEESKMVLQVIMRNSERINTMLSEVLDLGKKHEADRENHSIHDLLDEILAANEDRTVLKKITVRKNYTARDFMIVIKRAEVRIALTNIIINAIESMPEKGGLLEVATKQLRGTCVIIIKDNGVGISKENLENVFKPYFTTKPGGMGLGLSNTLSILNSNDIEVNLRSAPGKGTRFMLWHKKK